MAEPPRPTGQRLLCVFGILVVCFVLGSLLVPDDNSDEPETRTSHTNNELTFVDYYNHPVGFRMLVPLVRSTKSGKDTWFETTISFGYSVAREDTDAARAQIRKNFTAAGTRIKRLLSQHERMDYVSRLESITSTVRETLNETLFPNEIAKVESVSWDRFEFRSNP